MYSRKESLRLERDRLSLERSNSELLSQIIELKRSNLILEVSNLNTQINLHFVFNILNTVYNRIFDTDEEVAGIIVNLANLMRYRLYESNKELALLSDEIECIKNYLDLERLRYLSSADIDLIVEGDASNLLVAPLLLISFVENAFKHGVQHDSESPFIHIGIRLDHARLEFSVRNSLGIRSKFGGGSDGSLSKRGSGIGNSNTRRRLELLYPEKHSLSISSMQNCYQIVLHLSLSFASDKTEARH